MKYYWISWHQPTEDHRPLAFPPNEGVLGWWCSGQELSGKERFTLVAHVKAGNEDKAKEVILKDWPEAEDWRFCEERGGDPPSVSSRFPLSDWMKKRYKNL